MGWKIFLQECSAILLKPPVLLGPRRGFGGTQLPGCGRAGWLRRPVTPGPPFPDPPPQLERRAGRRVAPPGGQKPGSGASAGRGARSSGGRSGGVSESSQLQTQGRWAAL